MFVKLIAAPATYSLRQSVLRPHQTLAEVKFAGDEAADTFHLGIYAADSIIGIVSLYKQTSSLFAEQDTWQLRGMATEPTYQGKGCGRMLVQAALAEIASRGGKVVWCNAREVAVKFYEKLAFKIEGECFNVADLGPHYVMWRHI